MADRGIAGHAAVTVVDIVEFVDLDRQKSGRSAVTRGLAQHALDLAHQLAGVEQGGQRIGTGILARILEPGAGVGERGAEQRILIVEPRQRLARFLRGAIGFDTVLAACHGATLGQEG